MNTKLYQITCFLLLATSLGCNSSTTPTDAAALVLVKDTTSPVVADPVLVASSITTTGLTLTWTAASDVVTEAAELTYQVYYASSDLTTVAEWQDTTQATQVGTATAALTTVNLTGLTPATTYYFMVIVSDEAGNSSLYNSLSESTIASYIYMYTYGPTNGALGGRSGADALCAGSTKPSACTTASNVHAFLTVSASDYLSVDHFATTASTQPPSNATIVNGTNSDQIASSWSDLLTNGGCQSSNSTCSDSHMQTVIGSGPFPWVGSETENCEGWQTPFGYPIPVGTQGNFFNATTGAQMFTNISNQCDFSADLICVCW